MLTSDRIAVSRDRAISAAMSMRSTVPHRDPVENSGSSAEAVRERITSAVPSRTMMSVTVAANAGAPASAAARLA